MNLESLVNELLLDLFEFLSGIDLLRAFQDLNVRFNTLLFVQFRPYRFDFRSISKQDFDIVLQRYFPSMINQIISLRLSDDDETPGQIHCFLSQNWHLRQFSHLQLLSLSYLRSEVVMSKLMAEIHNLQHLTYLKLMKFKFCHDHIPIYQFLNNIWSLPKLNHCYLDVSFERGNQIINPSMISTSLQYLTIVSCSYEQHELIHLLQYTPYLRHLCLDLTEDAYDQPLSFTLPSMITLQVDAFDSPLTLTNLLQNMPNLRCLIVEADSINMNGHQWEQIIVKYLPKLKMFRLQMLFILDDNENKEQRVDELLNSFRTRFWLEERQWFVRCDWDRCQEQSCRKEMYLYTLPYAFNNYYFHDSNIKAKSTCPDDDGYPAYNNVYTINYEIVPSDNRVSSQFTFSNIHELDLCLPVDNNFLSIMPRLEHLKSLTVAPSDSDHDLDSQSQLQALLDRTPCLYSLGFTRCSSSSTEMPPFEYSCSSVRRLDLKDIGRFYNIEQCVTLSRSPLGIQCELLSIRVENRTNIIDLLNMMTHLRALDVISRDDPWTNDNDNGSSPMEDELIAWLQHLLPSTYTITRSSDKTYDNRFLNSLYSVRLWIG